MTTEEPSGALIPIEVRIVEFYGDEIASALVRIGDEAQVYVPIRPICDYLGLSWSGQRERIMRDEVLAEAVQFVRVTRTNTSERRGDPDVFCLPLDLLPGFLFGVSAARVKPELKDRIVLYRRECYRRLWDAFKYDILPPAELMPAPGQSGAQIAYELATAVANLAREQMEAEKRLGTRIDNMALWAKHTGERITALEIRLSPSAPIDEGQAAELQLAVKTVANALEQRGAVNGYGRVYSELYRKYGVSTYKAMPRASYEAALAWLRDWFGEIEAGSGGQ